MMNQLNMLGAFLILWMTMITITHGKLQLDLLNMRSTAPSPSLSLKTEYSRPKPSISPLLNNEESKYEILSLPGLRDGIFFQRQWAGHIPIPYAGHDHYGDAFYWMLEPDLTYKNMTLDNAPIIVWLNGGPGCSSLEGLFIENGPFRVQSDGFTIDIHDYSWHKLGWTIFIDQPIGTGLSRVNRQSCDYCDYVHNQSAVNSHMYSTLQSLMRIHPTLQDRKIYFTGESYAGHYIPAITDYILEMNKHAEKNDDFVLPIGGLALGNGWTDPEIQYNFGEFAHNIGLITAQEQTALETQYKACLKQEHQGDYSGEKACNILNNILASSGVCPSRETAADDDFDDKTGTQKTHEGECFGPIVNYYDIRSYYADPGTDWPENSRITETYLSRADVQAAVHINTEMYNQITFKECNHAGHNLMKMDGMGVVKEVIRVLDVHKVPMLFYNGQFDLICNHLGTETLLNLLTWTGQDDFVNAPGGIWAVPDPSGALIPAGYSRASSDNLLTFLVVIGGSHMVPMDVPRASLDMIDRFIEKKPYIDGVQPYPRMNRGKASSKIMKSSIESITSSEIALSYLIFVLICLGIGVSALLVVTVIQSYWNRGSKYHRIRAINHDQGADFSIHSSVEFTQLSSSIGEYQQNSSVDSAGNTASHGVRSKPIKYRPIIP